MVRIGLLGDAHIDPDLAHTQTNFESALTYYNGLSPTLDALILGGDNVADHDWPGKPWLPDLGKSAYEWMKPRLDALAYPYYLVVGNHDHPKTMKDIFGQPLYQSFEIEGLRFILISSFPRTELSFPPQASTFYGHIDADCRKWFEEQLRANPTIPTFLFLHHEMVEHTDFDYMTTRGPTSAAHPYIDIAKLHYWIVINRPIVKALFGLGNIVAIFENHLFEGVAERIDETINGVTYPFISGWHCSTDDPLYESRIRWLDLDPATATGTVYEYNQATGVLTTITTLSW